MPAAALPALSEETIDDILYFARANETDDLFSALAAAETANAANPQDVLALAVEPNNGSTALHYAAANGHTELLKRLLAVVAPVGAKGPQTEQTTSSLPDTSSTTGAAVHPLINAPNHSGNTPLHWAALNGHLEAVKALIDVGADVEAKNKAGKDAVFEAEGAGKEDIVNYLLGVGAEREVEKELETEGESEAETSKSSIEAGITKGVEGMDVGKE